MVRLYSPRRSSPAAKQWKFIKFIIQNVHPQMLYVLIGISALFIITGFLVTEGNAKYLLSGYNTMREVDRQKIDIKAYIPRFRKFHIFLGVSLLIIGVILTQLVHETAATIFLLIYPLLAYIFFIAMNGDFTSSVYRGWNKIAILIIIGVLLLVLALMGLGFKESKLTVSNVQLKITGMYHEELLPPEIQSVALADNVPNIILKTNGFSVGSVHKGYYKTKDGEIVKLILDSEQKPLILITKTNGKKVYYSAKEQSNVEIYNMINIAMPGKGKAE